MPTDFGSSTHRGHRPKDEQTWYDLYTYLRSLVRGWVFYAHVVIWYGQQEEIVEEIVQETVMSVFEYTLRSHRNEGPPVVYLKAFSRITAYHLFIDLIRKEKRLVPLFSGNSAYEGGIARDELPDVEELAVDHLVFEETVGLAAELITRFPNKQREALLRDLADAAAFAETPSLLERKLAEQGIQLRNYAGQQSDDSQERSRQTSLRWHGYKRLRREL